MNSPIRWYGGKGHLTKHLLKHVPPHTTYVEPFGGGASLLFVKEPSKVEVYNDIDSLLVNFFRVLKKHSGEFMRQAHLTLYSREEHKDAKGILDGDVSGLEDGNIEAAVAFYILCRQSMSGDLQGGWSYGVKTNCANSWVSAIQKLPDIVYRLRQVQIEHDTAFKVIERYDTEDTFFYLDPPYYKYARGSRNPHARGSRRRALYRYELKPKEHEILLKGLQKARGMILLSGYHCDVYDGLLSEWHHEDIQTVAQAAGTTRQSGLTGEGALKEKQKRVEVLWWNENLQKAMDVEEMPLFVEKESEDV